MTKKEAKDSEIEVLRNKVEELGKEIDRYIKKEAKKIEKPLVKKENRGYLKILVVLVILLFVVDAISLVAYYKPDLSDLFKFNDSSSDSSANGKGNGKCSDGTSEAECSKNKPFFCYNGNLLKNARMCGCPPGYKPDFQDCVKG